MSILHILVAVTLDANSPQCNEPYSVVNIIPILPVAKVDIERLETRAKKLRDEGLTHSLKKLPGSGKKRKKNGDISEKSVMADSKTSAKPMSISSTPQSGSGTHTPVGGIKNATTASLTAKVLEEQELRNKRRRLETNDNLKTLFSSKDSEQAKKGVDDFMTRGYSIPTTHQT